MNLKKEIMDLNKHSDENIRRQATDKRVEVPGHLWADLEQRLDARSQPTLLRQLMKVAAVLIPMLVVSYFILPQAEPASQVVDLSQEDDDAYFEHYRDFIQSQEYANLLKEYKGLK